MAIYDQTASSSSSSLPAPTYKYHVFLSFRGADTRTNFTDHLYSNLTKAGIVTFRDNDEIERGEDIKSELERGVKQSRMSILVFSKDYLSSRACLYEVETILEHHKKYPGHIILPIFYLVEPAQIKQQARDLAAVATEERQIKWAAALKKVASLGGMPLKSHQLESVFIKEIVEMVEGKLTPKVQNVSHHHVGMNYGVGEINLWLKDEITDVCMLMICGMGGIGKTTISKGSGKIEGLILDMNMLENNSFATTNIHRRHRSFCYPMYLPWTDRDGEFLEIDAFKELRHLRLLRLSHVKLFGSYAVFPKELRWLYWRGLNLKSLPNEFQLENIVSLDIRNSSLERVWKETKLVETPNFSNIRNLEKLILKNCPSLVKVDESLATLRRLIVLNLKDCKSLRKLPTNIGMVQSLKELIVSGCSNLVAAAEELGKLKSLKTFHANNTDLNQLLSTAHDVEIAPSHALSIANWVPIPNKRGNPIRSLPHFIRYFAGLKTLDISASPELQHISWPSTTVKEIIVSDCGELKQITYETSFGPNRITHGTCMSLNYVQHGFKIEPIRNVDSKVLKNLGLSELKSMASVEILIANTIVWSKMKCPIQGDQVEVSFDINIDTDIITDGEIKECGVEFLYVEDEDEDEKGVLPEYFSTLYHFWDSGMDIFQYNDFIEVDRRKPLLLGRDNALCG
ncbi:hypothetical protein LguiB_005391 [Lonicera macranthoides]